MIFELFKIYFRVGAFGLSRIMFYSKYKRYSFLLPPKWWSKMLCALKRHDYDLHFMGPNASKIQCLDCSWTVQSSLKNGIITTKQFFENDAKSGKVYKVKVTETKTK